jgi:hypothetical protein
MTAFDSDCPPKPHRGWLPAVLVVPAGLVLFLVWRYDPARSSIPLCGFHAATGLHCPGCGATRATHELLHGRVLAALRDNALWVLSLPLVAYQLLAEGLLLLYGRKLPGNLLRRPWFLWAAGAVALVFAVLRNIPLYPLVLLAPPG